MTTPNLYGFATKELAQDATIAYILAWADPKYSESHCRLHALGTELLRCVHFFGLKFKKRIFHQLRRFTSRPRLIELTFSSESTQTKMPSGSS